ncbi:MAG: pyrroline-5-carboxylate reductase [Bacteroidales bacterium]|nr:pyrroline-5-carboxylate reductase [Bacteroidales bacterium]
MEQIKIAIIGTGNLGLSIVKGLLQSDLKDKVKIIATRRKWNKLPFPETEQLSFTTDNKMAVSQSDVIIFSVQPEQFDAIALEVKSLLKEKVIISTITGLTLKGLKEQLGSHLKLVRSMPNTAIGVSQSMTCLSHNGDEESAKAAQNIFNCLGKTLIIEDELMQAATVLGASGIAFWMRLIRATTQGGIQLGFDAQEAKFIAVQTCLGAASILESDENIHPESEIDRVTTPKGCTIKGLNQMEHEGMSSALIHGLVSSYEMITEIKDKIEK